MRAAVEVVAEDDEIGRTSELPLKSTDERLIARVELKMPPASQLGDEEVRPGAVGSLFRLTHPTSDTNLVVFSAN